MTVKELQNMLAEMVHAHPEYADLDVCYRSDNYPKWDDLCSGTDVNVLECDPTGYKFLAIGDWPSPGEAGYQHPVWPI